MSYKKMTYSPPAKNPAPTPAAKVAEKTPAKPDFTTRQGLDASLKELTQIVEKDPKKAAEVFKSWLAKPSKVVKPKRAA